MKRLDLIKKLQQCRHDDILVEFHTEKSVLGWKPLEAVFDVCSGHVVLSVDMCDFSAEENILDTGHVVH